MTISCRGILGKRNASRLKENESAELVPRSRKRKTPCTPTRSTNVPKRPKRDISSSPTKSRKTRFSSKDKEMSLLSKYEEPETKEPLVCPNKPSKSPSKKPRLLSIDQLHNIDESDESLLLTPPTTPNIYNSAKWLFARGSAHKSARAKLFQASLPTTGVIVGREAEADKIIEFVRANSPDNKNTLYIAGPPGTGKTALINELRPRIQDLGYSMEVINAMSMSFDKRTREQTYQSILEKICGSSPDDHSDSVMDERQLESCIISGREDPMVLVIDEIDDLYSRLNSVYINLLRLAKYPNSNLVLVGISNALNFTERLSSITVAQGLKPETITFLPYNEEQISNIIASRFWSLVGGKPENQADNVSPPLMENSAIKLVARKTAATTGDLRKAFDICCQALDMVEEETRQKLRESGSGQQLNMISSLSMQTAPRAGISHVSKLFARSLGMTTVARVSAMSIQQKAVLCSLVHLERYKKSVTIQMVADKYKEVCELSRVLNCLKLQEVYDMINALESAGIVNRIQSRHGTSHSTVSSNIRHIDLLSAIGSVDILKEYLL
ncbi:hypothetical protein CANCADRAFT_30390 [Tortispora caseinolytica NRRL Y-17796]|uniref:Cell division control protein n=1 Tax=Tortispora caseinolytica NRRL Y-17796 TaxID=767744 RepID=A0A1E4TK81_9ASCO|nr:hypothetical protein CANCADRAFT_30390 [Tortispora caseinolytica NRRL Y-17796]